MNSQNILNFWGSKLDLKLDSSEFHDYEIAGTGSDYDAEVLDLTKSIEYDSLKINTTELSGTDCVRTTISLVEIDNRPNNPSYPYSAFTLSVEYSGFTNQIGNLDTILEDDVYEFTNNDGRIHYFEIGVYNGPLSNLYSLDLSGFTSGYTIECLNQFSTGNTIDTSICCPPHHLPNAKPWAYHIDHGGGDDYCDYYVNRRNEKGWTIDVVFNKDGLDWSDGNTFYYWGVRGEEDEEDYADNNLSFGFTDDGKIIWSSVRYSGHCDDTSGYTETYIETSGTTEVLCSSGTTEDFEITITFERNNDLTGCVLSNSGGWYDLLTGRTMTSDLNTWFNEDEIEYVSNEVLNKKWSNSRDKRLGTLRIYLNGNPIYKLKNWEEVIMSDRGFQPFIQSWGRGTYYSGGYHNGDMSCFDMKRIKYFEEPLTPLRVKHHYLVDTLPTYSIVECSTPCVNGINPDPTPTPSVTPSCPLTTQHLEVRLGSCHNFSLRLYDDSDYDLNAIALCNYVVSGVTVGDQGTIYYGSETILEGSHVLGFNLNSVLQPGECVTSFSVISVNTSSCPCPVTVDFSPFMLPPSPSPSITPTPSPTPIP